VACVACAEDPAGVLEVVFAGCNDSGPKIPVEAAKVVAECVAQFGPFALGAKVSSLCYNFLARVFFVLLFFTSFFNFFFFFENEYSCPSKYLYIRSTIITFGML
jgi:hypothetical protein